MRYSQLDGYKAASFRVCQMVEDAWERRPSRRYSARQSAAYRDGYYDGLLAAHCLHALGDHPGHNEDAIRSAIQEAGSELSS